MVHCQPARERMAKLLTLCVTLLLLTAVYSDGETTLAVDTGRQSDRSLKGRTNKSQSQKSLQGQLHNSQSGWNLQDKPNNIQEDGFHKSGIKNSQAEENLQYQTNSSQPEDILQYQTNSSQSEDSLQYQTNSSQQEDSLQYQTNSNQPEENLQYQKNSNQPEDSLQNQTHSSKLEDALQYQTNTSRPEDSLQYQTNSTRSSETATSPPHQVQSSTSLNDAYMQTRSMNGRMRQDNSRYSTTVQRTNDVTNTDSTQDKNHGPVKEMSISTKNGQHKDYATAVSPVRPVAWVNHLSTKQTASQRHLTDGAMISTTKSPPSTATPVLPNSTVPRTPVGEGVVWSKRYGFHFVDLVACVSTQLHDVVIPLEKNAEMEVQWRALAMNKATGTDMGTSVTAEFTCEFRVVAKRSRFLSGKLRNIQLRGGVHAGVNITIAGGKKIQHMYQSVGDGFTSPMVFPSVSSELILTFRLSTRGYSRDGSINDRTLTHADVHFDYLLTPQSGFKLEKGRLSFGLNYIRSFAFGGYTRYAHDTDIMVHIAVTGTVVSFPHFDLQDSQDCQADRLTLSSLQYTSKGTPEYTEIWSQCSNRYISPQVYDHHLALHFVSDSSDSRTGFEMRYSTHPLSQLPQQLPSGLFNCSVPHYPDFRMHFHCNLERECVAGEDESDCPYTSTDCRSGYLHVDNKCYLYLPVRREITWHDASELCQRQGRRLVSWQNHGDDNPFSEVCIRKKTSPVLFSLVMSHADTMDVFGSHLHLPDDSLESGPGVNNDRSSPHCAYALAMVRRTSQTVTAIPCNSLLYVHFVLCEEENTFDHRPWPEDQEQEKTELWTVSPSGVHINLTACSIFTAENVGVSFFIPVEDGMRLEARGVPNSDLFLCSINLVSRYSHYIATVIKKFEVDKDLVVAENDDKYTALEIRTGMIGKGTRLLRYWPNYKESDFEHAFIVVCNESRIEFNLQSEGEAKSIHLELGVLVSARPGTDHLSHLPVPPQGGILTSFAFDGHTRYAHETNAIYVLNADGVVISFPYFDLEYDHGCLSDKLVFDLYQYSFNYIGFVNVWSECGRKDILTKIYYTRLRIRFITGASQTATGFQMRYSKHPLSQLPQQPQSDLFNCSVPHYPDFRLHFHCNLEQECVAGEDEADCPYTSRDCGSGHIDAGNKCYVYLPLRHKMTWYEASKLCRSRGERLVSPRTPSEWSTFRTITDYGKKTFGVFVGLSTSPSSLQAMYREVWRWEDQTMAFYLNAHGQKLSKPTCAYLPPIYRDMLEPIRCSDPIDIHYVLCEKDKAPVNDSRMQVWLSDLPNTIWPDSFIHCHKGHLTHRFLSCDFQTKCGVTQHMSLCPPGEESVLMFECDRGSITVHYSLVCDHRQDCIDGSDENWCQHAPCAPLHAPCNNQQCVLQTDWCDGMRHCMDGTDEDCLQSVHTVVPSVTPPAVVTLDGHGTYDIQALDPPQQCPVTHFLCSPHDYCLPVYLRCNDVYDCPGREDEDQCDSYTCPGFYRCRASSVCVHSRHVCDGIFQCPQQDDEWLCDLTCPKGCRCHGLAFICNQIFPAHAFPSLRYLDASDSGMRPRHLGQNHYLVRLSLARCGLTAVDSMTLPNLRWLDLSANTLTTVNMQTFAGLTNLRVLRLAQNPLTSLVPRRVDARPLNLHTLDLSLTELLTYHGQSLTGFPFLIHLNISHGALATISEQGLYSTPRLQVFDVRKSPLDNFPQHMLRDLVSIHMVYADNFKLCCPAMLPDDFNPNNCHAPVDEIASCDDLLRSNAYRVSLWFMSVMALVGNSGSLVYRVIRRESTNTGFHVFVSNLSLADILMGLYLAVIGAADAVYRGEYLWNDKLWRYSATCQVAGFLSLLSSEMSAFFICLITLDRFIVLRFPFSQVRFHTRSALAASALAWTGGCLLALVPFLPMTLHWRFYSQTGICIPLPITRATFKGRAYSFGVMVVFNFVLFVLIALGQLMIFLSVRKNSMIGSRGEQDAIIARRLTTIVLSDFLCWFPIGLLGLLASTDTPISSELNVGMAIFVLPFNSALNPFLYTFNVLMEKRRKAAEARVLERLKRQIGGQ